MLNFVEQVIRTFDIGQDNVRVGVVTFSGRSVLQFHLNKYSNINQLLDAISKIKYLAGSTNTADALRYIRTTSFLKQNGDRNGVPNIVIVITDGKSNVPMSTSAEAAKLKMIATIFSIGIGTQVGTKELKAIATDEKHIFTVNNFHALVEIKHSLAIKTCEAGKETENSRKCPAKADIVFILDSSGSIGRRNFKKIIKFVQSISKHFNVKSDEVQIGLYK
ncbi:COL6A [Acanthosepion pharaonis]|uniref:COL6A n=1 Tax=Acanthosepion pharaonis TaxID=158019 RepID=A0A812C7J1_ACAPH|nr:COL6A [Sepia pharaonis]